VPRYLKESTLIELAPGEVLRECAARQALVLVSGKWTPLVVFILSSGTHRFSELLRRIDGISQKMLTQTLRSLESANCVERKVIPSTPIAVEYTLTALGQTLVAPLLSTIEWANEHAVEAGFTDTDTDTDTGLAEGILSARSVVAGA
jgi:DNA-binding HxlR family transcriptional regulator